MSVLGNKIVLREATGAELKRAGRWNSLVSCAWWEPQGE